MNVADQKRNGWVNAVVTLRIPLDDVTVDATPDEKLNAAVRASDNHLAIDSDLISTVHAETVDSDGAVVE